MSTTKTATIGAWCTTSMRPSDVHDVKPAQLVNDLGYSSHDMSTSGWVRVGDATITIKLLPLQELTQQTIEALRREQAELVAKCTAIDQRINNLLAIEHSA